MGWPGLGYWAGLGSLLLFLSYFLFQTPLNLFEFKFKFEFKPYALKQIKQCTSMNATINFNPMINLIT